MRVIEPKPVRTEQRIAYGIAFFDKEEDALAFAKTVVERGDRYNGGWFDGMVCGRDRNFDRLDPETGRLSYAVTYQ